MWWRGVLCYLPPQEHVPGNGQIRAISACCMRISRSARTGRPEDLDGADRMLLTSASVPSAAKSTAVPAVDLAEVWSCSCQPSFQWNSFNKLYAASILPTDLVAATEPHRTTQRSINSGIKQH